MRRSPALPYLAWALIIAAIVLVGQPGLGDCARLHPGPCANALLADLSAALHPSQGLQILLLLTVGWTVIAAARGLGRATGIAFGALAILVGIPIVFFGRELPTCLGLMVAMESCWASAGLSLATPWDRFVNGNGPLFAVLVLGWLTIGGVSAWRRRQRGGL